MVKYKIEQNGELRANPYFTARRCVLMGLAKLNDDHPASCVMVSEDGNETVIPFDCSNYSYDNERISIFSTVFLEHPMAVEVVFKQPCGNIKIVKLEETND